MNRIKKMFSWVFYPTRTSELIVAFMLSWWVVAFAISPPQSFISPTFQSLAANTAIQAFIGLLLILVWMNYFRLLEPIRRWISIIPVLIGVYTTTIVWQATPRPFPSMGYYIGGTLLAIFVCVNNSRLADRIKEESEADS